MNPPHLPPKTSNVEQHRHLQRLKFLSVIVVLSLIAGMSGASVMLGWIWPKFAEGDSWISSYTRPGMSRAELESRIREEVGSRIVAVYRGAASIAGTNYFNKKMGDGIILSSDGWLAVYQPAYDSNYKNIYVVTENDNVFQPENAVWDKYSGILYIKIKNEQFRVAGFMDEGEQLNDIFVWQDNNWYHGVVLYPVFNYKIPHLDTAPIQAYSLNGTFNSGEIAINNQGRVAGIINDNNLLLPGLYIVRMLPQVLSRQTLVYPSLGVEGWFSQEQTVFINSQDKTKTGEKTEGFLITSIWSAPNVLKKGDLILEINGRVVTPDNLWYIITDNETVTARVLRDGKTIELQIQVTDTK